MKSIEESTDSCEAGNLYRLLPSVNDLLLTPGFLGLLKTHSHSATTEAARTVLVLCRNDIADGQHTQASLVDQVNHLDHAVAEELKASRSYSLRTVINATGVILHTNLGRAPLAASALKHIQETAGGYSNLEFDVQAGERGKRDVHVDRLFRKLLAELISVEVSTIVVNNN